MKKILVISLFLLSACAVKKPVKHSVVHRTYNQVPADVKAIHKDAYHLGSSLNPCDTHHYVCMGRIHKKKDGTCYCIPKH